MYPLLQSLDGVVRIVRPLSRLLDTLVERLVPQQTALACSCPYVCYSSTISCGGGCYRIRYGCGNLARDCFAGTTWTCTSICFC